MNNNTLQPNNVSQGTLDPTVVNLSKSIRQQESGGNFQDVGDSGTSKGAYQWQPETWKAESTKYLGANAPTSPLDATPEQQNEVAYKTLADWKTQGLTQAQSASKWNSGSPSGYLDTNQTKGNTPQYVKNVEQNYAALKNGQSFTTGKNGATDTSAHTQGMPTWEKIALGIGTVGAVGAGVAFAPEIAAGGAALASGAEGLLDSASSIPLVGKFIPGIAADLGINKGISAVKGLFGGNNSSATTDAEGEEAATENAGNTEANATNQASQNQIDEEQLTNDQNEANNENNKNETETQNLLKQEQNTSNAFVNSVASTPTGKVLAQQPWVQQAGNTAARNGYLLDTSTGYNDVNDANEKTEKDLGDISNGTADILDIEGKSASIDTVREKAYANIKKYVPIPEQEQARATVDKQLAAYQKEYGNTISLGNAERAKRYQGKAKGDWQKDTPTKNGHKSLYHALRDTVTENTEHKDLYNRAMKEEQKIYDVKKLLKKMSGKKAFEHKGIIRGALKAGGKYLGTYIGDKIGGAFGAIVGTMVGDHLTKAVDKRFGKTYFESKEGKKLIELASKKSPHIAKVLKQELKKYGVKAEEMKKQEFTKNHQAWQAETMAKRKDEKRTVYKEKKKGLLDNHDKNTKNPYMNLEDFSKGLGKDIQFGKPATPKKKKYEKGLLTIKD